MTLLTILKNMIFSNNLNLRSLNYRLSPIFYKRIFLDFILRLFIFLPFLFGAYFYLDNSGFLSNVNKTMLDNNQKLSGYMFVILLIVFTIILTVSLLYSLIGSLLKFTVLNYDDDTNDEPNDKVEILSDIPTLFGLKFLSVLKNLWFVSFETVIIISLFYLSITYYVTHSIDFSLLAKYIFRSFFVTGISSSLLALLLSLPYKKIYYSFFKPKINTDNPEIN